MLPPLMDLPSDHWKIRLPAVGRKIYVVPTSCLKPSQWESVGIGHRRRESLGTTPSSSTSVAVAAVTVASSSSSSSLKTMKKKAKTSHLPDAGGQQVGNVTGSPFFSPCPINALISSASSSSPAIAAADAGPMVVAVEEEEGVEPLANYW